MERAVVEKGCRTILFDSVSDFWSQEYVISLFRLLNSFQLDKDFADKTKCFCFIKSVAPEDYEERVKDFAMLAEKVIFLNTGKESDYR